MANIGIVDPKIEEDKKKKRAERFGDVTPSAAPKEKKAKKPALAAPAVVLDPEEEAKRKARAMRFALSS